MLSLRIRHTTGLVVNAVKMLVPSYILVLIPYFLLPVLICWLSLYAQHSRIRQSPKEVLGKYSSCHFPLILVWCAILVTSSGISSGSYFWVCFSLFSESWLNQFWVPAGFLPSTCVPENKVFRCSGSSAGTSYRKAFVSSHDEVEAWKKILSDAKGVIWK